MYQIITTSRPPKQFRQDAACVFLVTGVAWQGRCRAERFEPVAGRNLGTFGSINPLRSRCYLGVTRRRQVVPTVFQNLCIISCAATWLCSPLHSAVEVESWNVHHSIIIVSL